jgi:hypothetical protein
LKLGGSSSGDYVGVADNDVWAFGTNDFSIELWAKFLAPGGGSVGEPSNIFIGNDEGPGDRNKWFFALGGGYLNFHINSPTLGPQFFPLAPFSPALNTWYHLAVTRSGSLYSLYINGALAKTATNSASVPNAAAFLTIGEAESLGFMNGLLDEVTIYNRALTAAEITSIWAAGSAGKCKASSGPKLQIQSVSPVTGGNAGQTTVSITGAGFQPGAVVNLVNGDPTILVTGSNTGITPGGLLQTTFDLTSVTAQNSQIQVVNPDGTSATSPFPVVDGGSPVLQLQIVGPATARVGREAEFVALLQNVGSVDADYATITASVQFPPATPTSLTSFFEPSSTPSPTAPQPPVQTPLDTATFSTLISPIPAGVVIPVTITFTPPIGTSGCGTIDSGGSFPTLPPPPPTPGDPDYCNKLLATITDLLAKIQQINALIQQLENVQEGTGCNSPPITDPLKVVLCNLIQEQLDHLEQDLANAETRLNNLDALYTEHCPETSASSAQGIASSLVAADPAQSVCPVSSWDPNAKVGPAGIGTAGLVPGGLLQYTVFFENLASATAPAQQISVVDPLDPALDASTVSVGTLSLSGTDYDLGGGQHVSKTVDLRPGTNALLQVQADVNTGTRQTAWTLTALDPTTLQLPSNPQVGILPPNQSPPQGEGSVAFTVSAKQGTAVDTVVTNQATVTFDVNPPIQTNLWSNTIELAFFAGEDPLSNGVYYLQFPDGNLFGYYGYLLSGWIFHFDMGYEYIVPASSGDGTYLWDLSSGHWFYSSPTLFPYLYDFSLSAWLYYFPDTKNAGHYTTGPRYFVNLTTNNIFTM